MREVRRYRIIDPRDFLARSVDPGIVCQVGFDRDGRLAGRELGLHFPAIDRKAPQDLNPHSLQVLTARLDGVDATIDVRRAPPDPMAVSDRELRKV